jgi:hypothetical protein
MSEAAGAASISTGVASGGVQPPDLAKHVEALSQQLESLAASLTERVAGAQHETLQHLQLLLSVAEAVEVRMEAPS